MKIGRMNANNGKEHFQNRKEKMITVTTEDQNKNTVRRRTIHLNFEIYTSEIKTSPETRLDERAAVTKQTSNSESQPNQTFVQTQKV